MIGLVEEIQRLCSFGNRSQQQEGFLMHWHDPRWILVAWLVVKMEPAPCFWRITGPFRARLRSQQRLAALELIKHVNRWSALGESVMRLTRSE